ncbi:15701_t:CDS:1, partial [Gigaspora rosea]
CELDQEGKEKSCEKWSSKNEFQGLITRYIKKQEKQTLELDQEMFSITRVGKKIRLSENERQIERVLCQDLDIEIIRNQPLSSFLQENFIVKNKRNYGRSQEELIFYTDGSLRKSEKGNTVKQDNMGIGWVQVDEKEGNIIDEGCIGA